MRPNNYLNAWASMLAIAKQFSQQYPQYGLTTFDFDENVNEAEYPLGNLIGIYQLDYAEDNTMMTTRLMFVISIDETFMLNEAVGNFVNFVADQTKHPLYNYGNQQVIGHMVALNELAVSPATKSTNRQFKFILQGFAFDRSASLPTP